MVTAGIRCQGLVPLYESTLVAGVSFVLVIYDANVAAFTDVKL
jgi:hypothetical protein